MEVRLRRPYGGRDRPGEVGVGPPRREAPRAHPAANQRGGGRAARCECGAGRAEALTAPALGQADEDRAGGTCRRQQRLGIGLDEQRLGAARRGRAGPPATRRRGGGSRHARRPRPAEARREPQLRAAVYRASHAPSLDRRHQSWSAPAKGTRTSFPAPCCGRGRATATSLGRLARAGARTRASSSSPAGGVDEQQLRRRARARSRARSAPGVMRREGRGARGDAARATSSIAARPEPRRRLRPARPVAAGDRAEATTISRLRVRARAARRARAGCRPPPRASGGDEDRAERLFPGRHGGRRGGVPASVGVQRHESAKDLPSPAPWSAGLGSIPSPSTSVRARLPGRPRAPRPGGRSGRGRVVACSRRRSRRGAPPTSALQLADVARRACQARARPRSRCSIAPKVQLLEAGDLAPWAKES